MTKEKVWALFSRNWVFALYSASPWNYVITALVVSIIPWLIGAIGSIFAGAFLTFLNPIESPSAYLHIIGFSVGLIAFGWFINTFTDVLIQLSEAFDISPDKYEWIIRKYADFFANRNWLMAAVGFIFFSISNFRETLAIWNLSQKATLLEPWVTSPDSTFFGVYYGFLHVILVPFILGSGVVGLIGFVAIFYEIFKQPLILTYYRRTESVINLTAGLVMLTLIALSVVLLFGRPLELDPNNILNINISSAGIIQSIIATFLVLLVGSIPLLIIRATISEAKRKSIARWERLDEILSNRLVNNYEHVDKMEPSESSMDLPEDPVINRLSNDLDVIRNQIRYVELIPSLPIQWPSIAKVSISALLSISAPLIQDWAMEYFSIKI